MTDFDSIRTGTGTAEWAEVNENICVGCPNDCLYCYSAERMSRLKVRPRENWSQERLTKKASRKSYPARNGVVMFPSTHDITPFNVEDYIRVAKLILEKGNKLLIVSKPRLECMRRLLFELAPFKGQILFRFTIGTVLDSVSRLWEPGAPLPAERVESLKLARAFDFQTSISIEPMLAGVESTIAVVDEVRPYVTDTIWIGKMNKVNLRVDATDPVIKHAVDGILEMQNDYQIMRLFRFYEADQMIRWKDSIKVVLERNGVI